MIMVNDYVIKMETFPNGETKIKDFKDHLEAQNMVQFTYQNDGDLLHLMFVKAYMDEHQKHCKLWINYMPYSRMDRKIEGDLFTLSYVCHWINQLNFDGVYVVEPHSDVTLQRLHNSIGIYPVLDWLPAIMAEMNFGEDDRLVFPDKGAAKRYDNADLQNLCIFDKVRNPTTGRILDLTLKEGSVPQGAKCIIIDDLCSGGGTFQWTGTILKELGASDITLLLTHCEETIFKGDLLKENSPIDRIITTQSMMDRDHPKIHYQSLNWRDYV